MVSVFAVLLLVIAPPYPSCKFQKSPSYIGAHAVLDADAPSVALVPQPKLKCTLPYYAFVIKSILEVIPGLNLSWYVCVGTSSVVPCTLDIPVVRSFEIFT